MKPEHMVIEFTDGTTFEAIVHIESGKLHVSAGGFMGFTFVLEPRSVREVCRRLLYLMRPPSVCVVCGEEPVCVEDGQDTCQSCAKR
jgi:hypothetical protein